MPRLPRISSKEAIKVLESLGLEKVRQTGSHVIMKKLKIGTLKGILRQAQLSPEEFINAL